MSAHGGQCKNKVISFDTLDLLLIRKVEGDWKKNVILYIFASFVPKNRNQSVCPYNIYTTSNFTVTNYVEELEYPTFIRKCGMGATLRKKR